MCYCAPEVAELVLRRLSPEDEAGGDSGGEAGEGAAAAACARPGPITGSGDALGNVKGALRLELIAEESLDVWGLGLTLYELFSSGGLPLFPSALDASHLTKLVDGTVEISLGLVQPSAARHLLARLLALEPRQRIPLDQIARHAWLVGGLDTIELSESFAGLQMAQEVTQRQLAMVQAELSGKRKADREEAQSRQRVGEEQRRRREEAARRREETLRKW